MLQYCWILFCLCFASLASAQSGTLIKELRTIAEDKTRDTLERSSAYNRLTVIYYNRDLQKARRYHKSALKLLDRQVPTLEQGYSLLNEALLAYGQGQYEQAIEQALKAKRLAENFKDASLQAAANAQLGLVYSTKGYAFKATSHNLAAIKLLNNMPPSPEQTLPYYQIGNGYALLGDTIKALIYYRQAILPLRQEEQENIRALVTLEKGLLHVQRNEWTKAKERLELGLESSRTQYNTRGIAYGNYALGLLSSSEQFNDQAMIHYNKAKDIYDQLEDKVSIAKVLQGMSKVALERQQYQEAEGYLLEALKRVRSNRAMAIVKDIYENLTNVYLAGQRYEKAMGSYQKYHTIQDSIFNRDKNRAIAEIQSQYRMQELQRENRELEEKHSLTLQLQSETLRNQELKNKQNYYIIAGLVAGLLLIIIIGLLVFRQDKLKTRIRETELEQRALRSQMNPHFMFNSLNSIQSLIATDNNAEASIYLAKFSRLMRRILQNSRQAYIPLHQEMEFLDNYIELEQRRFKEAFDYEMEEEGIEDAHFVMIPPLVIQPFIENAIIHGLLRQAKKGKLLVRFEEYNTTLIKCTIEDNGIGRQAAAAFKTDDKQESLGIKITEQRLEYLTLKEKVKGPFVHFIDLKDDQEQATGTRIELLLPIKYKA
ncbi:MAG: tetratricopeptide repeat-containing sensor histidine kinase [Aureispira sp.]